MIINTLRGYRVGARRVSGLAAVESGLVFIKARNELTCSYQDLAMYEPQIERAANQLLTHLPSRAGNIAQLLAAAMPNKSLTELK